MQFIHSVLTFNEILTVSLLSWFVAQVLKTIITVSYTHLTLPTILLV